MIIFLHTHVVLSSRGGDEYLSSDDGVVVMVFRGVLLTPSFPENCLVKTKCVCWDYLLLLRNFLSLYEFRHLKIPVGYMGQKIYFFCWNHSCLFLSLQRSSRKTIWLFLNSENGEKYWFWWLFFFYSRPSLTSSCLNLPSFTTLNT